MECFLVIGSNFKSKQECIPVGCIPSAAVVISLGGSAPGGLSAPGGVCLLWGVSVLGVCVCSGGVSAPEGWCLLCGVGVCVCSRGCLLPGGRVSAWGVSAPEGVWYPSMHSGRPRPPPPCGQTHAYKNITFATSLQTVIS